jgi:hypothetical protein
MTWSSDSEGDQVPKGKKGLVQQHTAEIEEPTEFGVVAVGALHN